MSSNKKTTPNHTNNQIKENPTKKGKIVENLEDQQHVDPIPMEDLKMELREEKNKHKTKNNSSSDSKYK